MIKLFLIGDDSIKAPHFIALMKRDGYKCTLEKSSITVDTIEPIRYLHFEAVANE